MSDPVRSYDEPSDTLYVNFERCNCATYLGLSQQILLGVDADRRRVVRLMIQDFSVLANRSDLGGVRSFPMDALEEMSPELQKLAMRLAHSPPVSDYLTISTYSPGGAVEIPTITLNTEKLLTRAA
ncbi:MAG TPA: hypothetical protein VFJ82_13620 [Longimicrobium sp.]|nr:hypothetical protein [Longimicrobium sp.]